MRPSILAALLLYALTASTQDLIEFPAPARATLKASGVEAPSLVPAPALVPADERTATFIVTYNGFTPEAEAAFQYAVDIWSGLITSNVPIVLDAFWADLPGNTLGSAGPTGVFGNFAGAPEYNVLYPSPLADKLAGYDLQPGVADIEANFDDGTNWYYGLDGAVPPGQMDFVTVVLHEIGHGLGFVGGATVDANGVGSFNIPSYVSVFDGFVSTGSGDPITTFLTGTTLLGDALTSQDLIWTGPQAGTYSVLPSPVLYAPDVWEQGSSLSHFDEATYPNGSLNSLMTPAINGGEVVHSPGPMGLGLLEDIGWTVDYDALSTGGEGCTDPAACNYDPAAFPDDGSCIFLEDTGWCNCDGALDVDDDGICDDVDPCIGPDLTPEVQPSVPSTYIAEVTLNGQPAFDMTVVALIDGITAGASGTFEYEGGSWVSMTIYADAGDVVGFQLFEPLTCSTFDIDSTVAVVTSGGALSTFDDPGNLPFEGILPLAGCTDPFGCNYNPAATEDDGSCYYAEEECDTCGPDGTIITNDADGDGICDWDEVVGCLDEEACNFDPQATEDVEGACEYPWDLYDVDYVDCWGECLNDTDGDGVCDEAEIPGCMDVEACNFDPQATDDFEGACEYPWDLYGVDYVDCTGECLNDADGDGVCDEAELPGCTDAEACNFWEEATEDDGTCAYLYVGDIFGPGEVVFGDTATYAADNLDAPSDFDWIVEGGEIISGLGTAVITVVWDEGSAPGTGSVTLIEYNPFCKGDPHQLDVTISPVVGLEEQAAPRWHPVPNPARDGFRLGPDVGPVMLFDLGGALVRSWNAQPSDGWYPLDGIAPGCYLIRATSGPGTWTERLIVMP